MTEDPTPLFAGDPAPLGLGDSWECWYCLKLLPSSYSFCDTCGRDRDRDDTPVGEIPRGTAAVPGAASTQSCKDTTQYNACVSLPMNYPYSAGEDQHP